jgi:hypothetical protein
MLWKVTVKQEPDLNVVFDNSDIFRHWKMICIDKIVFVWFKYKEETV